MFDEILTSSFTVRLDVTASPILYFGLAEPGADESKPIWQIKKVERSGEIISISFANGNDYFLNVWRDRASLTYL
jgi:hypothetical protein